MLYSDYRELEKEITDEKKTSKLKLGEDPRSVTEGVITKIRRRSDESMMKIRKKLNKVKLKT